MSIDSILNKYLKGVDPSNIKDDSKSESYSNEGLFNEQLFKDEEFGYSSFNDDILKDSQFEDESDRNLGEYSERYTEEYYKSSYKPKNTLKGNIKAIDDLEPQSDTGSFNMNLILEEIEEDKAFIEELGSSDDILGLKSIATKKDSLNKVLSHQRLSDYNMITPMSKKIISKAWEDEANKDFLLEGIKKIWEIDSDYQRELLELYLTEIRKVPKGIVTNYVKYLEEMKAFVNITDNYMVEIFGESIKNIEYNVFIGEHENRYSGRLMMPLYFMDGTVKGFVGYSPVETNGNSIKYLYPERVFLKKGTIMFCNPQQYLKAIRDKYVIITDGLFDAMIFQILGYNALSLCGSAITEFHKVALSKIKYKIFARDMDKAGTKLLEKGLKYLTNVRGMEQLHTNDMDDYFKGYVESEDASFEDVAKERIESFHLQFKDWKDSGFIGDLRIGVNCR